jgi:hypothetical protein
MYSTQLYQINIFIMYYCTVVLFNFWIFKKLFHYLVYQIIFHSEYRLICIPYMYTYYWVVYTIYSETQFMLHSFQELLMHWQSSQGDSLHTIILFKITLYWTLVTYWHLYVQSAYYFAGEKMSKSSCQYTDTCRGISKSQVLVEGYDSI